MAELTLVESHFRFGENWAEFAQGIDSARIAQACSDLARLLGREDLSGLRFIDIGSGSGIHSLAALRLGAAQVLATDIDPDSVETTKKLLERFAADKAWRAERRSVLDIRPEDFGQFDLVYSWGVLHHTGAMYDAIRAAAALVNDGGRFCVALYGRTALCGFWKREKQLYSKSPRSVQRIVQGLYVSAWWCVQSLRGLVRGRPFSLRQHARDYVKYRGMNFYTDAHDWLGGYPYESATPDDIRRFMAELGLVEERSFIHPGARHGLFGAGCDEYVFRRAGK